ncbi:hypothetical protein INH39_13010 [Massilia violaceinigra]|uniref:Uncharacterized protein n=1 Tax=Massilia violaceinigra TaxID=2045208 RepID=A0ABY4AG00_9BURK|nr:hypothetical protein [Massilia violaceinigra]UOD32486.1 hypothetical protein INH39_13010 [Massilia violaceinigra]
MDKSLRMLLEQHSHNPSKQYELAGITADGIKHYILSEMQIAIAEDDWEAGHVLIAMTVDVANQKLRADILNNLLIMPGLTLHQEVTRWIQDIGHPSSTPYIREMLERGYDALQYTAYSDEGITKWFSHALSCIDTPESIALIREFASSPNTGIATQMRHRLKRIAEDD